MGEVLKTETNKPVNATVKYNHTNTKVALGEGTKDPVVLVHQKCLIND